MTDKISICSAALLMLGADEITSFIDETREAKLCSVIYENIKKDMLSQHPWRFSIGQVQLAKLATEPLFEFNNAFQLPTDLLKIDMIEDEGKRYKIYEDRMFTNEDEVRIAYQFEAPEEKFPSYFIRLLEFELAHIFSVALFEDVQKSQEFERLKLRQMAAARGTDSQLQPNQNFSNVNFVLTNVRL